MGCGQLTVACIDPGDTQWHPESIYVPSPEEGPFVWSEVYPRQLFPSTVISSDGPALAAVQINACPDPSGYPCAARPVTELFHLDTTDEASYIRSLEDLVFRGGAFDAHGELWLVGELEETPSLVHIAYF